MKKLILKSLPLYLITTSTLLAGNLGVPLAYDSAKVLPKGVRNLRYNNVMAEANDKYNNFGSTVGVGDAFNVDVSFAKLIDGQDTDQEKGKLEGFLKSENISEEAEAGKTTGEVNVEIDAHVPILAWGITRKWTAAVVVPVVEAKTNADFGFVASDTFQAVTEGLVKAGKEFKAREMQEKTNNAIVNKIEKYGYKPVENEEKQMLGDIRLVNKYQLQNHPLFTTALTFDVVLPTGETAEVNKVVDPAAGDGQFDLAFGGVSEFYPTERLTLSARVMYTWQIQDTARKRIPETGDSTLTPDVEDGVERDLGDSFYASVGGNLEVVKGFHVKSQYSFQYKEADTYKGTAFEPHRYAWMSRETNQRLHAIQLGLSYSTLRLFKEKKFPVPLELNLNYGRPLSGKNVTKDPVVIGEFAMFF